MNEIKNFLTEEECSYIINLIKQNNQKSKVVGQDAKDVYGTQRTSSTSNLSPLDPIVNKLHNRISNFLGIPLRKGESLQGQMYEPGQFFKPHQDAFGEGSYKKHCLYSGNRTNTFMIYLNDDFTGGGTDFPNINKTVIPEKGKGVTWKNLDENKNILNEAMHEGQTVESGIKYIITSWWRENEWNGTKDLELFNSSKEYSDYTELPKLTTDGFKLVKCPNETWGIIKDVYELLKFKEQEELFDGKTDIIKGTSDSSMMSFEHAPNINKFLHKQLKPLHEQWANTSLEESALYGIRSYKNGSSLIMHRDRVKTHHVSSIICVDKDLNNKNDWALKLVDHNNKEHNIYMNPGDLLLYESATCLHGRPETFEGNFYNNFFVHYKLV